MFDGFDGPTFTLLITVSVVLPFLPLFWVFCLIYTGLLDRESLHHAVADTNNPVSVVQLAPAGLCGCAVFPTKWATGDSYTWNLAFLEINFFLL